MFLILDHLLVLHFEFFKTDLQNLIMFIKLRVLNFESRVFVLVIFDDLLDVCDFFDVKTQFLSVGLFFFIKVLL